MTFSRPYITSEGKHFTLQGQMLDTEGVPMIEVKHFEADSYEEAMAVKEAWLDHEHSPGCSFMGWSCPDGVK